jgi:hypothetical protein
MKTSFLPKKWTKDRVNELIAIKHIFSFAMGVSAFLFAVLGHFPMTFVCGLLFYGLSNQEWYLGEYARNKGWTRD